VRRPLTVVEADLQVRLKRNPPHSPRFRTRRTRRPAARADRSWSAAAVAI